MTREYIYVCSPYKGDIETNTEAAKQYCRYISKRGSHPLCPHIYFTQFLNDDVPEERNAGMAHALAWLDDCDRMYIFLNDNRTVSEGMQKGIEYANDHNIPIRFITLDEVNKELYGKDEEKE